MNIGGKSKEAEGGEYVSGLEKRISNLEHSMQNLSNSLQQGTLTPEQEQRVLVVEERLENVEDLQMIANLDLIKFREALEKLPVGAQPIISEANTSVLERRLDNTETLLRKLEERTSIGTRGEPRVAVGSHETQSLKEEISDMKKEFSAFKKENEEVIKVIISSIKRLSEVVK